MKVHNIQNLAETGSPDDVKNLLKEYGDAVWRDRRPDGWPISGNCIDNILTGIYNDKDEVRKAEKQSLVTQYVANTGVFSKDEDIPKAVAEEFREMIVELSQQVARLTEQVARLTGDENLSLVSEVNVGKSGGVAPAANQAYARRAAGERKVLVSAPETPAADKKDDDEKDDIAKTQEADVPPAPGSQTWQPSSADIFRKLGHG